MKKEDGILVTLPNIGYERIPVSVIKEWDLKSTSTYGDTIFCKFEDNSMISMNVEDYNKIFNKK